MRRVARVVVAVALATATLGLVPAGPAAAHTEPVGISPDPGARLTEPTAAVVIRFDAELDTRGSMVELVDEQGHLVAEGTVDLAALDHRTLRVAVPAALPEGTYAVRWRVRSIADQHPVAGEAGFAVGAADPASALTSSDDASSAGTNPAGDVDQTGGRSDIETGLWLAAFAAAAAFLGYAALPRRARHRDPPATHRPPSLQDR